LTRVAGCRLMLQPGSCLPEPLDHLTANTLTNIAQGIAGIPTLAGPGLDPEFGIFKAQAAEIRDFET